MIRISSVHLIVFTLTFASYALYHAARKTLSGVKSSISADWIGNRTHKPLFPNESSAQTFLGSLDALFMICYAVALIFWGWLGDRCCPRAVVVGGMAGSAVTLVAFGSIPYWLNFYSIPWYILTWALFGIVQACGWPNEVAIMANWFPNKNRGFIMGLWAACQPVGNILGALIISLILPMGYQNTFLFNSLLILAGAFILLAFVSPKPPCHHSQLVNPSNGLPTTVERRQNGQRRPRVRSSTSSTSSSSSTLSSSSSSDSETERALDRELFRTSISQPLRPSPTRPITMCEAILLPSVLPYCLCNACLKFVNYAFFFWLPFYLTTKYGWDESETNQLAIWYDIGGIVGSVLGGIASDRLKHRSPVLLAMLVASLPLLFLYANFGADQLLHVFGMTLLGFTISGPYNLIVGTIAVDLGSQPALAGNAEAMSTVTGLIDGTGSAGSAFGQLFVPLIQNRLGWNLVRRMKWCTSIMLIFTMFYILHCPICAATLIPESYITNQTMTNLPEYYVASPLTNVMNELANKLDNMENKLEKNLDKLKENKLDTNFFVICLAIFAAIIGLMGIVSGFIFFAIQQNCCRPNDNRENEARRRELAHLREVAQLQIEANQREEARLNILRDQQEARLQEARLANPQPPEGV